MHRRLGTSSACVLIASSLFGCGGSPSPEAPPDSGGFLDATQGVGGDASAEIDSGIQITGDGASVAPPGDEAGSDATTDFSDATIPLMNAGDQALPRRLVIENRCSYTVWADALPKTTLPNSVPLEVPPGQGFSIGWNDGWSGRVWGRTGCVKNGTNLNCVADRYVSNSLAEFTLAKTQMSGMLDFYDVSLVDGFNIPIGIINVGHPTNDAGIYNCGSPVCAKDIRPMCPPPLGEGGDAGILACHNDSCSVIGKNDQKNPACVYPNQYTQYFKMACPTSYSFPYDDATSTFTCKSGKDYKVVFCPSEGSRAGLP